MFRSGRRSSWSNGPAVFPAWHIVAVQESTPALPELPESTSQEKVHFVSLEVHKAVLSTSAVTTASFGDLLWDNTYHGNHLAPQIPQGIQRHPEHLDNILPWNETIQQNCK